jgi:hypothetical protein
MQIGQNATVHTGLVEVSPLVSAFTRPVR